MDATWTTADLSLVPRLHCIPCLRSPRNISSRSLPHSTLLLQRQWAATLIHCTLFSFFSLTGVGHQLETVCRLGKQSPRCIAIKSMIMVINVWDFLHLVSTHVSASQRAATAANQSVAFGLQVNLHSYFVLQHILSVYWVIIWKIRPKKSISICCQYITRKEYPRNRECNRPGVFYDVLIDFSCL